MPLTRNASKQKNPILMQEQASAYSKKRKQEDLELDIGEPQIKKRKKGSIPITASVPPASKQPEQFISSMSSHASSLTKMQHKARKKEIEAELSAVRKEIQKEEENERNLLEYIEREENSRLIAAQISAFSQHTKTIKKTLKSAEQASELQSRNVSLLKIKLTEAQAMLKLRKEECNTIQLSITTIAKP